MKSARELGRPGPGRVHVEFVGGPHCGERQTINVDPTTMTAPESIALEHKIASVGRTTVYLRRTKQSTNTNDGVSAWLYDAQRPDEEPTS